MGSASSYTHPYRIYGAEIQFCYCLLLLTTKNNGTVININCYHNCYINVAAFQYLEGAYKNDEDKFLAGLLTIGHGNYLDRRRVD